MNRQGAIALGVALFVALIAVIAVNSFLSSAQQDGDTQTKSAQLTRIVVASQAIEFGKPLTNTNTRLADWPAGTIPTGAFTNLADAQRNRIALQAIAAGEPILAARVTGSDGRATLATALPAGMVAISIPISDVTGVAGFVRPGDLVDILLTRQIPGDGAGQQDKMTDVIMRKVAVLGIDQVADKSKTEPAIGKTATVQVDTLGAQKLALARELGTLSLGLRSLASVEDTGPSRTVLARDLAGRQLYIARRDTSAPAPQRTAASPAPAIPALPPRYFGPTMTVYRKGKPTDYEVRHVF